MDKKINILFLHSARGYGGIIRNLSLLINTLDKEGFNTTVVSLVNSGDEYSHVSLDKNSDVILHRIYESAKLDFKSIHRVKEYLDKYRVDILSCHGYKADLYGFILRKFYGTNIKLVSMAHGWVTPGFKLQIYYFIDKFVMRYFDRIIFVSEGLRREIRGFMIPAKKICVINNAINSEILTKKRDRLRLRKEFGLSEKHNVIGFVGRLSKEKDIRTIILAVKKALDYGKNIKFLITGAGPLRDSLEGIAQFLKIYRSVIFTDYLENTGDIYAMLDIYISASLKEGLPNSLLEAQAAGVPCIATDITGNNDIIKDGVNGFLFKPRDYKTLARRIATLLEDKDLAHKFSAEGQRIIREKFSLQERIAKLERLYKGVAAEK